MMATHRPSARAPARRWTPAEDAELRRLWPSHTQVELATHFGATYHQVQYRLKALGLTRGRGFRPPARYGGNFS